MSAKQEFKEQKKSTRRDLIKHLQIPVQNLGESDKQLLDHVVKIIALTQLSEDLLK